MPQLCRNYAATMPQLERLTFRGAQVSPFLASADGTGETREGRWTAPPRSTTHYRCLQPPPHPGQEGPGLRGQPGHRAPSSAGVTLKTHRAARIGAREPP